MQPHMHFASFFPSIFLSLILPFVVINPPFIYSLCISARSDVFLLMPFMFCSPAYTGWKALWLEMCYTNKFYLLLQLLTKNSAHRLGCVASEGGEAAIISHPFFNGIDWEKLNRRELEPPFKPRIVSPSEGFQKCENDCLKCS